MRGYAEESAEMLEAHAAVRSLEVAARRYAAALLTTSYAPEADALLREAAIRYADTRPTLRKAKGKKKR